MKKKRFLILLLFVIGVGYFGINFYQLTLTDQIYVGQMGMINPDLVVGRDDRFPNSSTPTLDAQLLFSVWNRIGSANGGTQRLVVKDLNGNIALDLDVTHRGYSTVVNLHPIQQKMGKYRLTWYVSGKAIAEKEIIIE
ncbi:hypothetical protein [Brevibacillus sp. SYSU BS000544]|uniref:hypothetical protein n=1 Tax=Brevibacillus sp. SYSU BS000544 TaxID=3416443 RepID=UPI003CE5AB11